METIERTPAETFSSSEIMLDEVEARGWTVAYFADVLELPGKFVSELIAGEHRMTPEIAARLDQAFGTGAQFWLNLEKSTPSPGDRREGRT